MSQPPLSYASASVYPPSARPTAVSVLAIIGIVFGSLGVLCLGISDIVGLFALATPAVAPFMAGQPIGTRLINLLMGLCGLGLSAVLLWGSIASLSLKPEARKLMVGWAMADIIFDFIKLLVVIVILMMTNFQNPALQQNPAFRANPNSQQFMAFGKILGVGGVVLTWAILTTYAALVFVFFRKPEIVAAFEQPPQNPNPKLPMPPPDAPM